MLMPTIRKADQYRRYSLGDHQAVLLHNIQTLGSVEYLYILTVIHNGEPALFVTAEVNQLAESIGGNSHFLCVFQDQNHANLGDVEDPENIEAFAEQALSLSAELLGIQSPPQPLP